MFYLVLIWTNFMILLPDRYDTLDQCTKAGYQFSAISYRCVPTPTGVR